MAASAPRARWRTTASRSAATPPPTGTYFTAAKQRRMGPRRRPSRPVDLALPRGDPDPRQGDRGGHRRRSQTRRSTSTRITRWAAGPRGPDAAPDEDRRLVIAIGVGRHPGHLVDPSARPTTTCSRRSANVQFYQGGQGGGLRVYANAYRRLRSPGGRRTPSRIAVEPARGGTAALRRASVPTASRCRDAGAYSRAVLGPSASSAGMTGLGTGSTAARCAHHGQPPSTGSIPIARSTSPSFEPERKLRRRSGSSGQSGSGGPITVRLEPCGQAMARLVGPDGRPVSGQVPARAPSLVVTPGPPAGSAAVRAGALAADEARAEPRRSDQLPQPTDRRRPGPGHACRP